MLDTLQILFWSITYVLIIISGFQSRRIKQVAMPYVPGVLNFTWEICALYHSHGMWGHILWLSLDLVIVYFGVRYAKNRKQQILYITSIMVCLMMLMWIFALPNGMLISVFVIDLIMAVSYLYRRKSLSPMLKVPIAVTKLIGDAFAGLYYATQSNLVGIIACVVFMCNASYLYLCIDESHARMRNTKKT